MSSAIVAPTFEELDIVKLFSSTIESSSENSRSVIAIKPDINLSFTLTSASSVSSSIKYDVVTLRMFSAPKVFTSTPWLLKASWSPVSISVGFCEDGKVTTYDLPPLKSTPSVKPLIIKETKPNPIKTIEK